MSTPTPPQWARGLGPSLSRSEKATLEAAICNDLHPPIFSYRAMEPETSRAVEFKPEASEQERSETGAKKLVGAQFCFKSFTWQPRVTKRISKRSIFKCSGKGLDGHTI